MIGLVLSGGAARCIAHLGMLKVLDEHNVKIDMISGVSGGSITGALYSYGYKPDEIMEMVLNMSLWKLFKPALSNKGFLNMRGIDYEIRKNLPARKFEDLKIPLFVSATQLHKGTTTFFSKGDLIGPLLASNCIPIIFKPVLIEESLFVDGGIINNLPAEPLIKNCKLIIGFHTNPTNTQFEVKNFRYLIERVFLLAINYNAQDRKKMCDIIWEPADLQYFRITNIKKAKEIFNIGYRYGKEHVPFLLEKISDLNK